MEENEVLRGIVVRQMKQQAVRDKTKQLVLTELAKLEVNSKALIDQIEFLGQPVVKLTEREKKLFKQPTIEISDAEISIAAPKELAMAQPPPVIPAAAPDPAPQNTPPPAETSPAVAETKPPAPNVETPTPLVEKTPPLPLASTPPAGATPPPLNVASITTPAPSKTSDKKPGTKSTDAKAAKAIKPAVPLPPEGALPTKSANEQPKATEELKMADAKPMAVEPTVTTSDKTDKIEEPSTSIPAIPPPTSPTSTPDMTATTPMPETAPNAEAGSPAVPPALLAQARDAKEQFDKGNYRDAEKIYEKILAKAPSNLYILSNLGVVRFRGNKLKLAEEAFKKAIAIAPGGRLLALHAGHRFLQSGKIRRRRQRADQGARDQSKERDRAQLSRHHREPERLAGSRAKGARNSHRARPPIRRRALQPRRRLRHSAAAKQGKRPQTLQARD